MGLNSDKELEMVASMTAFAREATQQEWGQATWELRSVNHRYLDLSFRLPENFREYEHTWRNLVNQFLHRGKVECGLSFAPSSKTAPLLEINQNLVEQLLFSCQTIMNYPSVSPKIKAMELLKWPDVLVVKSRDISHLQEPLTQLLTVTLEDFVKARAREGKQLKEVIEAKLTQVLHQVAIVREKLPLCLQAQKQKLTQKLNEIQVNFDKERLEQELVIFAQRMDVEEEIDRLITHVKEVERALMSQGATGRRLDFLMQEMNREANTLGAKSLDASVTQAAIELKVLIEQMREQVQNVE